MATITTRSGKGSALTHNELDTNFTNLNTDKIETGNILAGTGVAVSVASGNVTVSANSTADVTYNNVTATTEFIGAHNGVTQIDAIASVNLTEGDAVYIDGLSGNTPTVALARSNSSSTMPAFGLAASTVTATNAVKVIVSGELTGLDAANFGETGITFALGDTVFVSASEAGKLTNVKPTGEANLIQNIGKIERATPTTNISILVAGAGRTAATPALNDGNIFIGNASNESSTTPFAISLDATPQLGGDLDVNSNSIVSASNGNIDITPNGTGSTNLTSAVLKTFSEVVNDIGTSSGTITPDIANGSIQKITLNGNMTFSSITGIGAGDSFTLIVVQDATGTRTLTSTMKFAGAAKTLSTDANAIDVISVFYDGTNYYASLTLGYA